MTNSAIKFEGTGPFYFRTVDHATARALANTVQLTLFASVNEREESLVQIETQMTPDAAAQLAKSLLQSITGLQSDEIRNPSIDCAQLGMSSAVG